MKVLKRKKYARYIKYWCWTCKSKLKIDLDKDILVIDGQTDAHFRFICPVCGEKGALADEELRNARLYFKVKGKRLRSEI